MAKDAWIDGISSNPVKQILQKGIDKENVKSALQKCFVFNRIEDFKLILDNVDKVDKKILENIFYENDEKSIIFDLFRRNKLELIDQIFAKYDINKVPKDILNKIFVKLFYNYTNYKAICDYLIGTNLLDSKVIFDDMNKMYIDEKKDPEQKFINYHIFDWAPELALKLFATYIPKEDLSKKLFSTINSLNRHSYDDYINTAIALLDHGADISYKETDKTTLGCISELLKNIACSDKITPQGIKNIGNLLKKLIEKGFNLNDPDKEPALYQAVQNKNIEFTKLLLEIGANPNLKCSMATSYKDYIPLNAAVENKDIEMVKLLLEKGADVNMRNKESDTPLVKAIKNKDTEMVKLLLEKGADINKGSDEIQTPLNAAIENKDTEMVKLLLEKGADINKEGKYSKTPLKVAIDNKDTEMVKLLLEKGADVNIKNKHYGNPASDLISSYKDDPDELSKLLAIMIEKGLKVNDPISNDNSTLLHFLSDYQDEKFDKVVELLVEKGADPNIQNNNKYVALDTRVSFIKDTNITPERRALLEKYGAKPGPKSDEILEGQIKEYITDNPYPQKSTKVPVIEAINQMSKHLAESISLQLRNGNANAIDMSSKIIKQIIHKNKLTQKQLDCFEEIAKKLKSSDIDGWVDTSKDRKIRAGLVVALISLVLAIVLIAVAANNYKFLEDLPISKSFLKPITKMVKLCKDKPIIASIASSVLLLYTGAGVIKYSFDIIEKNKLNIEKIGEKLHKETVKELVKRNLVNLR